MNAFNCEQSLPTTELKREHWTKLLPPFCEMNPLVMNYSTWGHIIMHTMLEVPAKHHNNIVSATECFTSLSCYYCSFHLSQSPMQSVSIRVVHHMIVVRRIKLTGYNSQDYSD